MKVGPAPWLTGALLLIALAPFRAWAVDPQQTVISPDELVRVTVAADGERLQWSAWYGGRPVATHGTLGLDEWKTGRLVSATQRSVISTWKPLYGERDVIPDRYHEMVLSFERMTLFVRAYEEGFAFRYRLEGRGSFHLDGERTSAQFPAEAEAYEEQGTEGEYHRVLASKIQSKCERPLTADLKNGTWVSFLEAGQTNYPRMLLGSENGQVRVELDGDVNGTLPFETPWRVFVLGRTPGDLLERNYLVLNLNPAATVPTGRWIQPGKVIREVTLSTAGGKAAVDFAASHGLQFVEYDAGWYGHEYDDASDARHVSPDPERIKNIPNYAGLDLPEVIRYAKSKGIGILLYVNRRALERQADELFPLYEKWGVAGVKFGFVQVEGQRWSAWMTEMLRKAYQHHLMVDVHDNFRPTGQMRTWPNLMTVEGVRGNEHMPESRHNATLPFTRGVAGAMDYTVAWMTERLQTTHAHQLALTVVYYSPWTFLFWYDRPDQVKSTRELEFFAQVPTTWNETRVLAGSVGEYAVVARRSGQDWFIGGITNERPRKLELRLGMLPVGADYAMTMYCDGATSAEVQVTEEQVEGGGTVVLSMGKNGGCAARLTRR